MRRLIKLVLAASVGCSCVAQSTVGTLSPLARIELSQGTPLYAVEGLTLNVYFRNVVRYEGVWADVTNVVTCAKGSSDGTKWSYTPTASDAGTVQFALTVKNAAFGNTLASKTVSLVTNPADYPASPVNRKLLVIGDSTTVGGTVSAELKRLFLTDTKLVLTEAGSNTGNASDSTAVSRAVAFDGITGSDFTRINSDTTVSWTTLGGVARTGSAFVNPATGLFDFHYYQTNWSLSFSAGDWVIFNLGINAINSCTSDASLNAQIATQLGALTNMLDAIGAEAPGVRLGVAITIPPNESIAAFQADYGASTAWIYRYLRNHQLWVERLIAFLESQYPSVALVPIHANLDCANNMDNSVHPAAAGYYQIAQSFRMFLKGNE